MNSESSPAPQFSAQDKLRILLAEYKAIERMHAHYDVLNMSMMAVVTAGVFTIWGLVIQSAFQSSTPVGSAAFVNSASVLAVVLFLVLSVWIRYMTIHRCIVILKLNRSAEIEQELGMKQNLIFRYDVERLSAPLDSDGLLLRRRPGGHTLELLLYLSLSAFGGVTALMLQWCARLVWTPRSCLLIGLLLLCPPLAVLWMTFCKMDAMEHVPGSVVGFPWNALFALARPVNKVVRHLLNLGVRRAGRSRRAGGDG